MNADLLWNLLNLAGFGVSVYALIAASSAKRAAREAAEGVVKKKDQKEDSDRLHELIASLMTAKDVAMRRQRGAPAQLSAGQDSDQDLHRLRIANDHLVTRLPAKLADEVRVDTRNASTELSKAIQNIQDATGRDGWKDALTTLQVLIPRLEQEERRQSNAALLDHLKD